MLPGFFAATRHFQFCRAERPDKVVQSQLCSITERDFYNISKLDFPRLLDDPNHLAKNVGGYITGFSKKVSPHAFQSLELGVYYLPRM